MALQLLADLMGNADQPDTARLQLREIAVRLWSRDRCWKTTCAAMENHGYGLSSITYSTVHDIANRDEVAHHKLVCPAISSRKRVTRMFWSASATAYHSQVRAATRVAMTPKL
jgi:hypothetical protein